jgi:hypothetical protein
LGRVSMVYGHRLGKELGVQSVLWFRLVVSSTLIRAKKNPLSCLYGVLILTAETPSGCAAS